MVLLIQNVEVRPGSADIQEELLSLDATFKVFEDGVTYSDGCNSKSAFLHKSCEILHENEWYKCNPTTAGGYQAWINPVCVEIILRSPP